MSSQPESLLSKKIIDNLRAEGYFCFKVHGGPYTMAGLPDIVVCANGLFIGLETKMPLRRSNVSPRQAHVHTQIEKSGGRAFVVCSVEEAINAVKEVTG